MTSTYSSSSSHVDPKSLKRPDSFMVLMGNFFTELAQNTRVLIAGLVALIVLGTAIALYSQRETTKVGEGRDALFKADKTFETELKALATALKPPATTPSKDKKADAAKTQPDSFDLEAVVYQKLDVDQKFPGTVKELSTIEKSYSGNRIGYEASVKLGGLYFDHAQYDKALPWFEKAVSSAPGHFEKALALSSLGYAQENLAKPADAIQSFQKALNMGEVSLKGDLLLALARNYESNHDTAKARGAYDQILSDLPNTDYSKTAERYKSQLK